MPGTVSEVSATLVASTMRRVVWAWKIFCCSAEDSRANMGTTSTPGSLSSPSASAASRISRSPDRKTRMSPGPAASRSPTALTMPVFWSGSSGSSGW
ncbi:Uncharacterised protein [Mycobacteroides abscessus subsp. abscessus]|nr:Uncharacterised protein [Mycobacteroides abscessus subsp. abscessus]